MLKQDEEWWGEGKEGKKETNGGWSGKMVVVRGWVQDGMGLIYGMIVWYEGLESRVRESFGVSY